jgi:hypothetical protein
VLRYRQVTSDHNVILVTVSRDGVAWSPAKVTFSEFNHEAVSPTWVRPSNGGATMAWYVNATRDGCGTAVSFVKMRTATTEGQDADATQWSDPNQDLHWSQPGAVIWHLKVREITAKNEYWALYPAYPSGQRGCGSDDLYFARSADGVTWQRYPVAVLDHRALGLSMLYRTDFVYDSASDRLTAWVSAMDTAGRWNVYRTSFDYSKLQRALTRSTRMDPSKLRPNDAHSRADRVVLIAP